MIDTVIFDLDGTLLNTLEDLTDSVNYALRSLGLPERTMDEIRMFVGNSVNYLIDHALPTGYDKQTFDKCLEIYNSHYSGNMRNKTAPYSGINDMLASVHAAGYKTAVVSNKSEAFTKLLVSELFGQYIDLAVGQVEARRRKPAPDGVLYALEQLGSARETAVYVGDSDVDVLTARNSGLPCIGVLWGFRDRETLERENATQIIASPSELLSAVKRIEELG